MNPGEILGALASLFGSSAIVNIQFTPTHRVKGLGLILKTGYIVQSYGSGAYGLTSREQVKVLDESGVPYEIIQER